MYGEPKITQAQITKAMETLRDLGVATVSIDFSGGNDEGGPDGSVYLDADGKSVDVPTTNAHRNRYWTGGKMVDEGWTVWDRSLGDTYQTQKRPATADEVKWAEVDEVLSDPIYSRWGSFAGEFYVHGTCTWDVAAGTSRVTGQETVETYEDFDY